MFHTWDDNLKDPAFCPHCDTVRCVKRYSPNGTDMIVPSAERKCSSCAWGPNAEAVKARRLAAIRAKMEGKR